MVELAIAAVIFGTWCLGRTLPACGRVAVGSVRRVRCQIQFESCLEKPPISCPEF